jgi:16S rRNA (uracil1498-N3)-methyltransferase
MSEPRLLIEQELAKGAEVALDEAQAHYVGAVLRLDVGAGLRLFNARNGEWRARVSAKTRRILAVRVEDQVRPPRTVPDLELLFAPVKRHATDLIVEKATELGVARLRPVITQRTIAETVRLDRLQAIAREAAEQTERFEAPDIVEPVSLARALDGWDAGRPLLFADEAGDDVNAPWGGDRGRAPPVLDTIQQVQSSALALLIGPEGGFTPDERAMLRSLTFVVPVSLGPRILRAETAVIAALSVIQAAWGDWRAN